MSCRPLEGRHRLPASRCPAEGRPPGPADRGHPRQRRHPAGPGRRSARPQDDGGVGRGVHGDLDAVVLAAAGLERLGLGSTSPSTWTRGHAAGPGQGSWPLRSARQAPATRRWTPLAGARRRTHPPGHHRRSALLGRLEAAAPHRSAPWPGGRRRPGAHQRRARPDGSSTLRRSATAAAPGSTARANSASGWPGNCSTPEPRSWRDSRCPTPTGRTDRVAAARADGPHHDRRTRLPRGGHRVVPADRLRAPR